MGSSHLIIDHLLGTVILLQHRKEFDDVGILEMKLSNARSSC